ncbi:hypothetical protein [Cerasicoccus arenae]|uniref:Uncharacterized protein n=1 Tax=Cerasicoccus arenae TaxID=424488 RepID=A0A8J3DD21_9BACT|nr:hypothetical protein [Cerasicoccus arenae]MBK1857670.1 hypothetical protein [Cerasicoccus arenae]GHB91478.1 hypothetical protein GCM10007047_03220 [Cerasicoccus arenae]
MDNKKIKERLAALRPEDLHSEDPEIEELLMLVEEDLELAEWFAQEQVFDQAFADKLQQIEPPAGLDERIIAAMEQAKAGQASPETPAAEVEVPTETADEKITPFTPEAPIKPAVVAEEQGSAAVPFHPTAKRSWWQSPSLMSAAAAIVLVLTVSMVMFNGPELSADSLEDFYSEIGKHHLSNAPLNIETSDLGVIRDYLSSHGAPSPGKFPANIDPLPEVGCAVMHWGGELISVVRMDDHENVDVYIARAGLFPDFSNKPQPQTANLDQIVVLAWYDGDLIYFLVRTGEINELEGLL